MTIEQDVRAALGARADAVDSTPLSGPSLRASAARHRRRVARRRVVTVVVAAVVAAAVLVVPSVLSRPALPPAATGVDTWPARGDLAHDGSLAEAVRTAWNAAPVLPREQPHRDVRVLLATRTPFGRYVMVTGFNALGHRRLAVFSDDPRDSAPYRHRLRLRSDAPFPADRGLLTHVAVRRVGSEAARRSLLLVVGPPDVTGMRWRADTDAWTALPSAAGVAASVVPTDYVDIRLRAYRGERRLAEERASERLTPLYVPDEELMLPEREEDGTRCRNGVCGGGMSGTMSATPGGRGNLEGVHRPDHLLWEDMAEQAEQLWLNWAVPGRRVGSTGQGRSISGLLPDRTGVHLAVRSVNDVPEHLVLYVDRPEWPLGRLLLVTPNDDDRPRRAVSALVPGENNGVRLVVLAGRGVRVRYRIAGGGWIPLRVSDGIGSTGPLGGAFGADDVDVETSFDGEVTVGRVDTFSEVDVP